LNTMVGTTDSTVLTNETISTMKEYVQACKPEKKPAKGTAAEKDEEDEDEEPGDGAKKKTSAKGSSTSSSGAKRGRGRPPGGKKGAKAEDEEEVGVSIDDVLGQMNDEDGGDWQDDADSTFDD